MQSIALIAAEALKIYFIKTVLLRPSLSKERVFDNSAGTLGKEHISEALLVEDAISDTSAVVNDAVRISPSQRSSAR